MSTGKPDKDCLLSRYLLKTYTTKNKHLHQRVPFKIFPLKTHYLIGERKTQSNFVSSVRLPLLLQPKEWGSSKPFPPSLRRIWFRDLVRIGGSRPVRSFDTRLRVTRLGDDDSNTGTGTLWFHEGETSFRLRFPIVSLPRYYIFIGLRWSVSLERRRVPLFFHSPSLSGPHNEIEYREIHLCTSTSFYKGERSFGTSMIVVREITWDHLTHSRSL